MIQKTGSFTPYLNNTCPLVNTEMKSSEFYYNEPVNSVIHNLDKHDLYKKNDFPLKGKINKVSQNHNSNKKSKEKKSYVIYKYLKIPYAYNNSFSFLNEGIDFNQKLSFEKLRKLTQLFINITIKKDMKDKDSPISEWIEDSPISAWIEDSTNGKEKFLKQMLNSIELNPTYKEDCSQSKINSAQSIVWTAYGCLQSYVQVLQEGRKQFRDYIPPMPQVKIISAHTMDCRRITIESNDNSSFSVFSDIFTKKLMPCVLMYSIEVFTLGFASAAVNVYSLIRYIF